MTVDIFKVVFHAWMAGIRDFMQQWTPFIGKLQCQREEAKIIMLYSDSEKDKELSVLRMEVVGHGPIGSMYI